ncbi:hypothetical protein [Kitasatospora mediocidica]|uniref:hypothetical protein n=1 Tax=Kitasatospora mediocidica TaxID=58352 RepID=UPI000A05EDE8|nr:hypothetical protein [Kitasatospora mediocidica]
MTRDRALALLAALPATIGPALSDAEVEATEERFGFRFAVDHRLFLQAGLPLGRGWPDWRNGDAGELRGRLDWPRDGVLFDVAVADQDLSRARASVPFWSYFLGGEELREIVASTPHDPYAVTAEEAVDHLLMLAIERRIGRHVGADTLIQAALVALVLDIDSPALRDLAGLPRSEESRAHELLAQVVEELGLAARVPATDAEARWALVRWWLQLIDNGSMNAIEGGNLISYEAWDQLDRPETLRPFVAWTSEYDDWKDDWDTPRDAFKQRIIDDARDLLAGPWPPMDLSQGPDL